ncbi:MAG: GUN4 domain-containing protein [Dolichospermum sp. WA123]|nr:GUN4 domain-containing protein [Dolichospermum sp. WA123]
MLQITRDYCEGMIEGFGYNPLTGKIYDKYVTYERKVVAGEKKGAIAELSFKRVTSTAELNSVLGIDASASLNASWFTGQASLKAKVSLESSEKTEEFTTFSVLYVKVREAPIMLEEVDLSPRIRNFLKENGLDDFYQVAGYEYIAGIIPGGEFISTIKIVSSNRETKEKVDAALNAQISFTSPVPGNGSLEANLELKSTFSQLAKNSQVRIEARCYRKGGDGLLVTNPEDALNYALNFPAYLRQSPSILQVICKPYQDLLSFPRGLKAIDMMVLQRQKRPLQDLFDIFRQKSQTIAQIDQILLNPMQFHGVEEDVLRKGKRQLEHQLDIIAENATKYANNPQDISVDSSDFPPISVALPARRLVELKSGLRMDYTNLSDLLAAKKWKEADQETAQLMLKCANREKERCLDIDGCRNFPQEELRMIDQLWLEYSRSRFGLSIQKKIWVDNGGKLDGSYDSDTYVKLADKVGWSKGGIWLNSSELAFSTNSLHGHLPILPVAPPKLDYSSIGTVAAIGMRRAMELSRMEREGFALFGGIVGTLFSCLNYNT